MTQAKVAILLAYYQHPAGLQRTLDSLRSEVEPFTLYLVDDGSLPKAEINPDEYSYPIVLLRHEKNLGVEHASNTGLTQILADGFDFIAKLDAADIWIPGRLAAQRDFLLANPDHALVGAHATAFDDHETDRFTLRYPAQDMQIRHYMHLNSAFCNPAVMMRSDAVRRIGLYSIFYPAAEDYEYFFRLLKIGKGANLQHVWVKYEVSATAPSISYKKRNRQLLSRLLIQCKNFNPMHPVAWWGIIRTMILLCFPYHLLLKIKSLLWRR